MVKESSIDFKSMAFCAFNRRPIDVEKFGVIFRKGKSVADVEAALSKALKPRYGRAKIEFELEWLELFLSKIYKAAPKNLVDKSSKKDV